MLASVMFSQFLGISETVMVEIVEPEVSCNLEGKVLI